MRKSEWTPRVQIFPDMDEKVADTVDEAEDGVEENNAAGSGMMTAEEEDAEAGGNPLCIS